MTGRSRALAFLALAVGIGAARRWVGGPVRVSGDALAPQLSDGDVAWAWRWAEPEPGDLVLVRYPGEPAPSVARLVARGGARVELRAGALWLDGATSATGASRRGALWGAGCAPRPVALAEERVGGRAFWTVPGGRDHVEEVPPGHVFVVHDQRGAPGDSRQWGSVPAGSVEGTVAGRIWRGAGCGADLLTEDDARARPR